MKKGKTRDYSLSIVAEMFGVTTRYVAMIRDGKRNNKEILQTYNRIKKETGAIVNSAKVSIRKKN